MRNQIVLHNTTSLSPARRSLLQPARCSSEKEHRLAPPIVHEVLRSPGRPLESATQTFMGARFGHDFSQVRVHTDARAVASARALNALAYTVGSDLVFGSGQYAPGTLAGRRLLAHELTHVIQQEHVASGASGVSLAIDEPSSPTEREAAQLTEQFARGNSLPVSAQTVSPTLQRQEGDEDEEELRLQWPGFRRQPTFQLRLDPEIEAHFAAMNYVQQLLSIDNIRSSLFQIDYSTFLASQPPPWLTLPAPQPSPPLAPRGAGPATPRPANTGDVVRAVLRIPAVDSTLTRLRTEATDQVRRDWERLSTGERALVISHTAVLSAGALAGILSSPEATQFTLNLLQNRALPVPGVPGLTFQFNVTGPNQMIRFDLNVGTLLPASLGFR